MIVRLECSSDHRGKGVPCAILIGDRRIEVLEMFDWWPGRDHRYFKVRGSARAQLSARVIVRIGLLPISPELTVSSLRPRS